jgi:2',3'-cyclic-nucleotide 2'-phosphodiesterase (5'-nucleotidase family)
VTPRPATAGIIAIAAAACSVPRADPGRVDRPIVSPVPQAPPPATSVASREVDRREGAREASKLRTIGRCDPAQKAAGRARFTIAHFNDLQARYSDRLEGKSRYAYIAGYLRELQADVPETLVVDAGDDYEKGAVAELRSMGETTRRMIQALPIDVRTMGNHDFAYGEPAVMRDVGMSAHPVLAANVTVAGVAAEEQPLKRFVRVDVGCVRVGVIGLVTQNYDADDKPTKKPFDGVFEQSTKYAEILEREVKEHRGEVDVLVALTHLGYWPDTMLAMSPGAKGLDLVFGGHTEDLLEHPVPVMRVDGSRTWIMQAGHFGRTLGRADLVVNLEKKSVSIERYGIVKVDASLPVAQDVADLADRLEHEAAPDARSTIATTRSEVHVGREMIDLVRRAVIAEWGADALILGRDVFWSGLPKGTVTLQRLYDAVLVQRQPSGTNGYSSLFVIDVTGAELAQLRARLKSPLHEMFAPSKLDPARTYKLAIEKRALTFPKLVFGMEPKLPEAKLGGELIDVLEAYARSRTSKGETLD